MSSSVDWTRESWPATCWRSVSLSRSSWAPNPADDPLCLLDQGVELGATTDVERSEPLEELGEVSHRRVAEDLGRAVLVRPRDPFGQVLDQRERTPP